MPFRRARISVGILGGSFNPPHAGHYHVAYQAKKRLGLNRVYFLVSPQNPLKSDSIAGTIGSRFLATKDVISKRMNQFGAMRPSSIESLFKSSYTSNRMKRLRLMHPETKFIWLMGADNLHQFHKWHKWRDVINNHHVSILDRRCDAMRPASNKLSYLYPNKHVTNTVLRNRAKPCSWSFFKIKRIDMSSTMLRAKPTIT